MRSQPVRHDVRKTTKGRSRAEGRDARRRKGWIPFLESLEGRVVLSTATWTGQDYATSDNWSDAGNWVDGYIPHTGDNVVFPDNAVDESPVNDNSPGMSLASITIQSGEYDLSGSGVVITGLLHANYGGDESVYEMSTQLSGGKIEVDGGGTLYVTGKISGMPAWKRSVRALWSFEATRPTPTQEPRLSIAAAWCSTTSLAVTPFPVTW